MMTCLIYKLRSLKVIGVIGLLLMLCSCTLISDKLSPGNTHDVEGTRAAKSALMASELVNAAPVRVSKKGDLIVLSGRVEAISEKEAAETIVKELFPEANISNQIEVR